MKAYNSIAERIEILQTEISTIQQEIDILSSEPKSVNEQLIFKFIETGSNGKTKDLARELGKKSQRGGLFSSGDVSRLIKEGAADVSPELLEIAKQVGKGNNKNGVKR